MDTGCQKSLSLRASPQTGVAICSQIAQFLRFSANLQLKDCGFPRRFAPRSKYPWGVPRNDRIGLSTRWGGVKPRPTVFVSCLGRTKSSVPTGVLSVLHTLFLYPSRRHVVQMQLDTVLLRQRTDDQCQRHANQPGTPAVRIEVQTAGSGKSQSQIYNSSHTHIPFTKKGAAPGCAL